MKTLPITLALGILFSISACHTTKKNSSTASVPANSSAEPPVTNTSTSTVVTPSKSKPANGVYAPGTEEVNAIIIQHGDVTLEKLTEGYSIYSKGECTACHKAKSIYAYDEMQWRPLLDDMAMRARLTNSQKDAVFKYILAIKAAKPR